MKFRDRDHDQPEPDDGLEARLTADAEAWLQEEVPTFTDTPAALLPGVPRVDVAPQEFPAAVPDGSRDEQPEEPTVAAPTRGTWARRAPLLVAAAVIALVAAVAIPLVANRSHTAAPTPGRDDVGLTTVPVPSCPQQDGGPIEDEGEVRAPAGSLVPAEAPVSMKICEYPLPISQGAASTSVEYQALRSSREVLTGLSTVPDDLSRFDVSPDGAGCWMAGHDDSPSGSAFRIALVYPDGVIWVRDSTVPLACPAAEGSAGYASGSYGDLFASAFRSGTWSGTATQPATSDPAAPQPAEHGSAECPGQVDASPFVGTDALPEPAVDIGGGELVPTALPSAVVLCGYLQGTPVEVEGYDSPLGFIARRLELRGDYSALVADLRQGQVIPQGAMRCPRPEGVPTHQLMGLTYGTGAAGRTIWVDAPLDAQCGLAVNGSTWVRGDHAARFEDALTGNPWPGVEAVDLATVGAPTLEPSVPATYSEPDPSAPAVAATDVSCPESVDATPFRGDGALPASAVDTDGQLVPEQLPDAVVLCGYAVAEPSGEPGIDSPVGYILQRIAVQGDYTALVAELRQGTIVDPDRMECPAIKDPPLPQLIALTYGTVTTWVDARYNAPCGVASNGSISTTSPIARSFYAARRGSFWEGTSGTDLNPVEPSAAPSATEPVTSAPETFSAQEQQACDDYDPGSGPDLAKTMIPAGYTSVISCLAGKVELPAGLVAKINALSAPVDASGCPGGDTYQDMDETPTLVFLYPDRDPVFLYFYDYCAPLIGNWDREVAVPKEILDQLLTLAGY